MYDLARRLRRAAFSLVVVLLALAPAGAGQSATCAVRYRTVDTIYLDAGRAEGLAVGDTLEIRRDGAAIANVEIVFVAEHSASCAIVSETVEIQVGDVAHFEDDRVSENPGGAAAAATAGAAATDEGQDSQAQSDSAGYQAGASAAGRRTRFSGSLTLDWEGFSDASPAERDYTRTAARLNLRVRDIGGKPFAFALRLRSLEWDRDDASEPQAPEVEDRDRLYEASLTYDPPDGRVSFSVGRIGTNPFVGIGYLDGGLAEVRVASGVSVGAFFGGRPVIEEFGFEDSGTKYGAYTRVRTNPRTPTRGLELFVAGIREDGEQEVSREYAAVEVEYRGFGNWSFRQHTEIDFNRGWRGDLAPSSTQLSNLSLVASGRLGGSSRLIVSYDRNERYRTEENRLIPEALFDDLWRQGIRARYQFGKPGALQVNLDAGLRDRQDQPDDTVTAGVGLYHPNVAVRGLLIGGNVSAFSNPVTDGFMARARIAKTLGAGHQLSLVLGALEQDNQIVNESSSVQWARLGVWVELPLRLFGRAELEYDVGDDLEGQRLNLGVGYRF